MPSSSTIAHSNLERFLQSVTPTVPSHTMPQSCINDLNSLWHPPGKDTIEYFMLANLWDCYDEWSAYGVGTSVLLNSGETVTQYYVPYLSAIQIYSYKSIVSSRNRRDDNDAAEFESDSWSDDSGSDNLSRSLSNNSSRTWDAASEDSSFDQESSLPMRERDRLGYLNLQYIEMLSPYWRVPLMDKIIELARNHPALMTLKSVDLSPASWMAVAWYPIYHIPRQKNEKDLSACFLTYHTLSSSFQENGEEYDDHMTSVGDDRVGKKLKEHTTSRSSRICLPAFGLATYKMQAADFWLKPDMSCTTTTAAAADHEIRLIDLQNAAASWLKQLNVHHHDFNFFTSHSTI